MLGKSCNFLPKDGHKPSDSAPSHHSLKPEHQRSSKRRAEVPVAYLPAKLVSCFMLKSSSRSFWYFRWVTIIVGVFVAALAWRCSAREPATFDIATNGAVGDGSTLNTKPIQKTIDQCAAAGGGTVVIPKGEFLTGALFLKAGVNLELRAGATLRGSTNFDDYPILTNARFEGHFEDRVAALLNVEKCDHFRVTGPGMIDGSGKAFWKTKSPEGRPRLLTIRDSRNVTVSGVRFTNSPAWNLHLYNCGHCVVENCRFEIPNGSQGPSTDGVDVDSSQDVVINGCYFSDGDDCVCLKGNRYDGLNQEPKSPPVRNVLVENCTFVRGGGALVLGTEAQEIKDIEMKDCVVRGKLPMLRIKFRPDTANQDYRNVHVHDIKLDGVGDMVSVEPYHGTKVPTPARPISKINGVTVENISGTFGSFGTISGGEIARARGFTFRNVNVLVTKDAVLNTNGTTEVTFDHVKVQMAQSVENAN